MLGVDDFGFHDDSELRQQAQLRYAKGSTQNANVKILSSQSAVSIKTRKSNQQPQHSQLLKRAGKKAGGSGKNNSTNQNYHSYITHSSVIES